MGVANSNFVTEYDTEHKEHQRASPSMMKDEGHSYRRSRLRSSIQSYRTEYRVYGVILDIGSEGR